jgi:hypothetical protein
VIRIVLAVVLTVALFATVLPAVEEGRTTRTAILMDDVVDRLERAARSLRAHEDPVRTGLTPARRTVRFRLPSRSWSTVGASLRVDGRDDAVTYRLDGRRPHRVPISGVDIRTPGGPVVVRDPGTHRLVLELIRNDGAGVRVRRG